MGREETVRAPGQCCPPSCHAGPSCVWTPWGDFKTLCKVVPANPTNNNDRNNHNNIFERFLCVGHNCKTARLNPCNPGNRQGLKGGFSYPPFYGCGTGMLSYLPKVTWVL